MTRPSFIIGGAPRSGTTWLYHALDRHPRLHMAKPVTPEPKFFLVDEIYARGLDHYLSTWFADVPEGCLAGEKSTNYMESAVAAQRMREHLPEAKLLFLLREPVARAFNNWLWSRTNNVETEDFETALALEAEREAGLPERLRYARPHDLFGRGLYAKHLRVWYDLFPREQILCLRFEGLFRETGEDLARIHRFLGVEERPQDAQGLGVINRARNEQALTIPPLVQKRLRDAYAEPNRALAELLPDFPIWDAGA